MLFAGELPKELPISLEVLVVSGNKFTGGIPSEWGAFTNLKELKMVGCGLDGKALSTRAERFILMLTFHFVLQENCPRNSWHAQQL